jgi:secreted trypsin-like serine protease
MTIRAKLAAAALAAVTITAVAVPARAVTNGSPDNGAHPYVGLMVADDADGNPMWRCTGTLISPTVYVTAGHCTFGAERVTIWFEEDIQSQQGALGYPYDGETSVEGTPYTHPQYDDNAFYLYDLGVVVLDEPITSVTTFATLPRLDQLDRLKPSSRTTFTSVGYGLQQAFPDAASYKDQRIKVRLVANPHLVQINTGYVGEFAVLLSNNAATGGTCFGDSGGPNFLGTSTVIAGVTSFGNQTCSGTGGVYRIDRADDLAFIASFVD